MAVPAFEHAPEQAERASAAERRPDTPDAPGRSRRSPYAEAMHRLAPGVSAAQLERDPALRDMRASVESLARELATQRESRTMRRTGRGDGRDGQAAWRENDPARRVERRRKRAALRFCSNCGARVKKRAKAGRCRLCASYLAHTGTEREVDPRERAEHEQLRARLLDPSARRQGASGPIPRRGWQDPTLRFSAEPESPIARPPAWRLDRSLDERDEGDEADAWQLTLPVFAAWAMPRTSGPARCAAPVYRPAYAGIRLALQLWLPFAEFEVNADVAESVS